MQEATSESASKTYSEFLRLVPCVCDPLPSAVVLALKPCAPESTSFAPKFRSSSFPSQVAGFVW